MMKMVFGQAGIVAEYNAVSVSIQWMLSIKILIIEYDGGLRILENVAALVGVGIGRE